MLHHNLDGGGGAERHVMELAAALGKRGESVVLGSRQFSKSTPPVARVPLSRISIPLAALRIARLVATRNMDLIHAHCRLSALSAHLATRFVKVPVVVTCHIVPVGWKYLSCWGDRVVCVSNAVKRTLTAKFGVAQDRCTVVYNGVPPAGDGVLRPPPVAASRPVFAYVARMVPGKGHDVFLRAFEAFRQNGHSGEAWLLGDGPLRSELERRYGNESVRFWGYQNDVMRYVRAADAVVLCSDSEALPYSLIEAQAAGVPAIATACGGVPEVVTDNVNGLLIQRNDPADVQAALERFCAAGVRARLAAGAAEGGRLRFNFDVMVNEIMSVYRSVVHAND